MALRRNSSTITFPNLAGSRESVAGPRRPDTDNHDNGGFNFVASLCTPGDADLCLIPDKSATLAVVSETGHTAGVSPFGRVVLVASLGGMQAFIAVLAGLPAAFAVPVAVVQHRPFLSGRHDPLVAVLSRKTGLPVRSAQDRAPAQTSGVAVVPGSTTATIDASGHWLLSRGCRDEGPGDALLTSSADAGPTIAVIMSGYQSDGARGCRAVKARGGRVLVQDPSTARAPSMPVNAIATGCADFVLPLDRIAAAVVALTTAPGAADLLRVPLPPWARL